MKRIKRVRILLFGLTCCSAAYAKNIKREIDFIFDWKFSLVEDSQLPSQVPLQDSQWRDVRLPHDWSVETSFDQALEGATGYLPGGVGIYQKHFATPADPQQKTTYIVFDGVYNNATYWLNGQRLGENPYGYSPVYFNLTDKLKSDGSNNILTVHVDHSRYGDSRWYTGSGIYRNVKLVTVDKLHIPVWGTFVTTPDITPEQATVNMQVSVLNETKAVKHFQLNTDIFNKAGQLVATQHSQQKLKPNKTGEYSLSLNVLNPQLWDIEQPTMYQVVTNVSQDGVLVDSYSTPSVYFRRVKWGMNIP